LNTGTGEAGEPHNHDHLQMMNTGTGQGYEDDAQAIHVVWAIDSGKFFLCSFLIFYHSTNFYFHYIKVLSHDFTIDDNWCLDATITADQ
jgi:hypothetical protein